MKIFYDKNTGREIVDISSLKTVDQIKREFGYSEYVEEFILSDEGYRIKNGKIEKYSVVAERIQEKVRRDYDKTASIDRIKMKLGLSDQDIYDIRKIL